MNVRQHIPVKQLDNGGKGLDGEGSVQVHLEPDVQIDKAKVFAIYGKGELVRALLPRIYRRPFPSSASA